MRKREKSDPKPNNLLIVADQKKRKKQPKTEEVAFCGAPKKQPSGFAWLFCVLG